MRNHSSTDVADSFPWMRQVIPGRKLPAVIASLPVKRVKEL